jgi:hypothetical protein
MAPVQWFILAVAPGFALFVLSTALAIAQAFRGPSTVNPSRLMALGAGLIQLGTGLWLLLAADQPWWVKVIGAPVPLLLSIAFFNKARRLPPAPQNPGST